jgi:hypothetical protein
LQSLNDDGRIEDRSHVIVIEIAKIIDLRDEHKSDGLILEHNMRTSSLLTVIGVASALNVGLWFWPRPIEAVGPSATFARTHQCDDKPSISAGAPQTTLPVAVSSVPRKSAGESTKTPPDQHWLTTVRDSVLQASLMPKFSDKVLLSGVECKGSACAITGSTKADSKGQWYGNSAVADFMHSMNDGQIAGGDTHRSVVVNQLQPRAGEKGFDFSLTVQQNEGLPFVNPCQSVLDMWNSMHPEDFAENPKPANQP